MAAGEQSGELAKIWRKDGVEHGKKSCREAGMGTWPLGFGLLSFCNACLRFDDFNVVRFWAGRPSPFTLAFDNSALTPVAIFAESTLCRAAVRARFEFFYLRVSTAPSSSPRRDSSDAASTLALICVSMRRV